MLKYTQKKCLKYFRGHARFDYLYAAVYLRVFRFSIHFAFEQQLNKSRSSRLFTIHRQQCASTINIIHIIANIRRTAQLHKKHATSTLSSSHLTSNIARASHRIDINVSLSVCACVVVVCVDLRWVLCVWLCDFDRRHKHKSWHIMYIRYFAWRG